MRGVGELGFGVESALIERVCRRLRLVRRGLRLVDCAPLRLHLLGDARARRLRLLERHLHHPRRPLDEAFERGVGSGSSGRAGDVRVEHLDQKAWERRRVPFNGRWCREVCIEALPELDTECRAVCLRPRV